MTTSTPLPLTACLESYLCPSLPIGTSLADEASAALQIIPPTTLSKLRNLGPVRTKDMRSLGHAKQIVSHIPISASPTVCAKVNDALFTGAKMNVAQVAALALIPIGPGRGKEAATELQRCVAKMKFVGGVVGVSRDRAGALCDGSYEEVWAVAENFRVPIVLREMWPRGSELSTYQDVFTDSVVAPFATHLHIAHNDTPLHLLSLYLSGIFDRHPRLRLVLAHPGLLPSLIPRIENILRNIPATQKPKTGFLDVWQNNIYITTADVLDISSMRTFLEQIPIDRVLYASNYPLEERGKELMEELRVSRFLTDEEYERLAFKNAEVLFGVGPGTKS